MMPSPFSLSLRLKSPATRPSISSTPGWRPRSAGLRIPLCPPWGEAGGAPLLKLPPLRGIASPEEAEGEEVAVLDGPLAPGEGASGDRLARGEVEEGRLLEA